MDQQIASVHGHLLNRPEEARLLAVKSSMVAPGSTSPPGPSNKSGAVPTFFGDRRLTVKRYQALGAVSNKKAGEILKEKLSAKPETAKVERPTVTFREHAERWRRGILPTYRYSVQLGHGGILRLHLEPKFGNRPVADITMMEIQEWITELRQHEFRNSKDEITKIGYASHSVDHYHEVLNAVMRTAVERYGLSKNPARGVHIGKVKSATKKWALNRYRLGSCCRGWA